MADRDDSVAGPEEARFQFAPQRRPALDAERIIYEVERQSGVVGEANDHLIANARSADLLDALGRASDPFVRQILCDICGFAETQEALPTLIALLEDPSPGVRSSAADAIGKIGASRDAPDDELEAAGVALLARFHMEPAVGMRRIMAVGLSGVRYRPALPALREAAEHDEAMRRIVGYARNFLEGNEQHAGSRKGLHWDVQHPKGEHTNVDPDGNVIGADNFPDPR